ncbi:cell adhesion molecule 4-like [Hoplias malabaricus]|uniref:cell adhesion molecule 4-like n=1 Tax=Hoplias malabaricus TaxID=27720 RepID=UPI00346328E9
MESSFIMLVVFHLTAGCTLSGERRLKDVTGHKGGSALIPCSCTDPLSKPQTITWTVYKGKRTGTDVFSDRQYRGRLQQFNEYSPANLSLSISDLREDDEGDYRCQTEKGSREFWLSVKACDLVKSRETVEVTGFSGESVVLPCSCTDPQTKPNTFRWEFKPKKKTGVHHFEEIYPAQTGQHRDRVRLTNQNSGDLSLLISHLTEEDQGEYSCSVQGDFKYVRLHVEVRETLTNHLTTPSQEDPAAAVTESQRVMMCVAHQKS